ncbi:helix-turn-helix domain-containing protein [Streptomyces olivaceus]|uniref:helix-turn-helix domain-containing protein n=1 Tax=Streptomyces olivaceus TaxID=47716 RepID=UPI004055F0B7
MAGVEGGAGQRRRRRRRTPPVAGRARAPPGGKGSRHAGTPRPRHRAGPGQARGRAEEDVRQGASVRVLAEGCGRSYGFVHRLLTEAGTTMRTRGGPNTRAVEGAGP